MPLFLAFRGEVIMVRTRYEMPQNPHLEADFNEQLVLGVVRAAMGRHADAKV